MFTDYRRAAAGVVFAYFIGFGSRVNRLFPDHNRAIYHNRDFSIGFHYYEACNQSLTLQWLDKKTAPTVMGRIVGVAAMAQLLVLGLIFIAYLSSLPEISWQALAGASGLATSKDSYQLTYLITGMVTVIMAVAAFILFSAFQEKTYQTRKIILRKRYWLYYALTFIAGARRQIFIVFAGFLMVEKFGYSVPQITALFLLNAAFNIWFAPIVGKLITRVGERSALVFEYIGLIGVFISYAVVESGTIAAGLYVLDHMFFAFAIAIKTYFQKIGDPADMASTASVAFTINHIAAVFVPVLFGSLWLISPVAVFFAGAAMAGLSLVLSFNAAPSRPWRGSGYWPSRNSCQRRGITAFLGELALLNLYVF